MGEADKAIQQTVIALATRDPKETPIAPNPSLISLAVRDGGLGLPRHKDLALKTYQAAREAANRVILTLESRVAVKPTLNPSIPIAKAVFQQANKDNLDRLAEELPIEGKNALLENASFLGRRWLQTLPIQKSSIIADKDAIEVLRSRLLTPIKPIGAPCSLCGAIATLQHQDTCKAAARRWIGRHNQVSRAFIKALSSRADLKVEAEPTLDLGGLRADFSVLLGSNYYYYDVKIVAIGAESADPDPYKTLATIAKEKRRKYQALGPYFHPIVISAGGLMDRETAQTYKGIQQLVGPTTASWLDNALTLALLRFRAYSSSSIALTRPTIRR